ncbi:CBS domain-containing protein [Streptomyces spiralis]|uniref:CBS domain-containing protein n=1 Tax=Streptomyces spiralis TaxID=66376 RepID=UPI0033F3C411
MPETPRLVSDVMTLTVVAVSRDTPFKEIVRIMEQWKISALPVLDGEGRVIGVVSEADLLPTEDQSELVTGRAVTAAELMSAPAVTVPPGATLAQAARIMAVRRVKRLPVVDGAGTLQGVVSRGDLLKVFLRSDEDIAEEVRRTVVSCLFPALSHTIHVHVHEGVVILRGELRDTSLVSIAERLARAVEGVVRVEVQLMGKPTIPAAPESRQ